MVAILEHEPESPHIGDVHYVRLKDVSARLGMRYQTVWNWYSRGVGTADGQVCLQADRLGGIVVTTWDWVEDFLRRCGYRGHKPTAETPAAAEARGKREQAQAARELRGRRKK